MEPDRFAMPSASYIPPKVDRPYRKTSFVCACLLWAPLAMLWAGAIYAVVIMAESLMSP
jgi:hypothetical protein